MEEQLNTEKLISLVTADVVVSHLSYYTTVSISNKFDIQFRLICREVSKDDQIKVGAILRCRFQHIILHEHRNNLFKVYTL